MQAHPGKTNHAFLYASLAVLVLVSVGVSLLHLSAGPNNAAVFAVAFVMAGLVVLQYMGLKLEGPLVLWTFIVPLILFIILVVLLLPDIAHIPFDFLKGL